MDLEVAPGDRQFIKAIPFIFLETHLLISQMTILHRIPDLSSIQCLSIPVTVGRLLENIQ